MKGVDFLHKHDQLRHFAREKSEYPSARRIFGTERVSDDCGILPEAPLISLNTTLESCAQNRHVEIRL